MDALTRLSSVPGVIGTMACDGQGRVIAHAFPKAYDPVMLQRAAAALVERRAGLEPVVGRVGSLDLRFTEARVVVRRVGAFDLLFLCAPTVNLQTLHLSISGAARALDKLAAEPAPEAAAAPGPAVGTLYRLAQRIEEAIAASGLDRFKVRGQIAFKSGLSLDLIDPDAPDDPAALEALRAAAAQVLGTSP